MVEALNAVKPCILDRAPWNDPLIEQYSGCNQGFMKDQNALWSRLVRLPRLISDVIEYSRSDGTNKEMNRGLRQRAHELHIDLDLSSLERSSLESLQLECHNSNAETLARTYGVIVATHYVCILSATVILIDRLIQFLNRKGCAMTGEVLGLTNSFPQKSLH